MIKISIWIVLLAVIGVRLCSTDSKKGSAGYALPSSVLSNNNGLSTASDSTVCKSVWSTDGSICDAKKLVSYQAMQIKTVTAGIAKVADQLEVTIITVTTTRSAPRRPQNRRLLPAQGPNGMTPLSSSVKDAISLLSPFQNVNLIGEYHAQMNTCWAFLQKAKSASLCYACSKENSKYFFKGKAIVTQADCKLMLGACLPFFNTTAILITSGEQFAVASASNSTSNWQTKDPFGAILIELGQHMKAANITQLLANYSQQAVGSQQHQTTCNELCARLFHLHDDPIFKAVEQMAAIINQKLAAPGKKASNPDKKARLLVGSAPQPDSPANSQDINPESTPSSTPATTPAADALKNLVNPFEGDVIVLLPNGKAFESFSEIPGVPQLGTLGHVPMNLSLSFP